MGVAPSSFFCELICYSISTDASVCWYPLKNNTGRLSEVADVLCELLRYVYIFYSFMGGKSILNAHSV